MVGPRESAPPAGGVDVGGAVCALSPGGVGGTRGTFRGGTGVTWDDAVG